MTSRSTSPASYGRFLCEVFDQWLATDVGDVFIQDVDSTSVGHVWLGHGVRARTPVRGEHGDGVQRGRVRLRSLGGAGLVGRLDRLLVLRSVGLVRQCASCTPQPGLDDECRACPHLRLCWGGCPKDRFVRRGESTHNYLCEGYRAFYAHATPCPARDGHADRGGQAGLGHHGPRGLCLTRTI